MIQPSSPSDEGRSDTEAAVPSSLIVVDVGNATTALGLWKAMQVSEAHRVPTSDQEAFGSALTAVGQAAGKAGPQAVVVASVVPAVLPWMAELAAERTGLDLLAVRRDIPLPIATLVREPDCVGVDRVCAAAAAFDRTGHACTVIDFGTAITVDLIDDAGTFVGGAILPGARLQARALAEGTAALPEIEPGVPQDPIGGDTVDAIRSGLYHGIAGAVRGIVEEYATSLGQWPQVVATGGDLELFLPRCDFIDSPVPDLTLLGVGLAYTRHRPAART